jgi:hypothetical protein
MTTGRAVVPNIFGDGRGSGMAGMDPDSHAPGAANPGAPNSQHVQTTAAKFSRVSATEAGNRIFIHDRSVRP